MKKHKILSIVFALIIGAMATLSLVACKPHEHNFGEWICNSTDSVYCENREYSRECECGEVEHKNGSQYDHDYETETVDPTCVSGGYDLKTCKICGKTETVNNTPETEHEIFYDFNSTSHWQGCKNCDYTTETASHTLNDSGLCTVCEQQFTYTEGLVFELSESGDYYVVVAYEGTEQDVIIPSIYDDKHVRAIGDYALVRHTDITSISIPNSVTSIGEYAFEGCKRLGCIILAENNNAYKSIDGNLYTKNGATLIRYAIGKTDSEFCIPDSVTSIGDATFSDCDSLTSVTIPDSVTSIGSFAFASCSSLKRVYYHGTESEWNDIEIEENDSLSLFYATIYYYSENEPQDEGNYWHYGDNGKVKIWLIESQGLSYELNADGESYSVIGIGEFTDSMLVIPELHEGLPVTGIRDYAFENCDNLMFVVIGDNIISIGERAFLDCINLESITISNSVASIGMGAFLGCNSLIDVYITDLGAWCRVWLYDAASNPLYYASNLYVNNKLITDLIIPDGVLFIIDYTFWGCNNLISASIPDNVISIASSAFSHCSSLESITIPDSVTSIGGAAFSDCDSLTSVIIGGSVTSIGEYAFHLCNSLESIYYKGTQSEWSDIQIDEGNDSLSSATIYYYSESEPQGEGNYWHYGDNGEVVIW